MASSPAVTGQPVAAGDGGEPSERPFLAELAHSFADDVPAMVVAQDPVPAPDPALVVRNDELAADLGVQDLDDGVLAAVIGGVVVPAGARPVAQAYAGHQFGGWSPQLGDGRQVVLGEVVAPDGRRVDLALKGSGRTPFSRAGDGWATLGPVLREHLMGEAMHALGVPTTRSLGVVTTGREVRRTRMEPGAALARVAASHLRVGTVQFAAATGDVDVLAALVDHALWRHGVPGGQPEATLDPGMDRADRALALLDAVVERQADLVAQWMHLGFIHGVMNTDNTTLSGETIDYGPCAFMERHDPAAVFSSIDRGGRYAYGNQPGIALWNLTRLAEALLPLIGDGLTGGPDGRQADPAAVDAVTEVLEGFPTRFRAAWLAGARRRLGLVPGDADDDVAIATGFEELMADGRADHTLAWRRLARAADGDDIALRSLFTPEVHDRLDAWLERWAARRSPDAAGRIRAVAPLYVPRNHLVEEALAAAEGGDLDPFTRLLDVVTSPFEQRLDDVRHAHPAPEGFTDGYVTFCGT